VITRKIIRSISWRVKITVIIRSLKIQAFTSIGKVFESRIEKGLREKISEEVKKI